MPKKTAVIGAGSWGTTLAIHASKCGHVVSLWVHSQDTLKTLIEKKTNEIYLPGIILPDNVQPTSDPGCVSDADYIIFAVPSIHFRKTFSAIMPHLRDRSVLISSIKGMEARYQPSNFRNCSGTIARSIHLFGPLRTKFCERSRPAKPYSCGDRK